MSVPDRTARHVITAKDLSLGLMHGMPIVPADRVFGRYAVHVV